MIPFVTIELDKPRKLRLGLAAMVEFEQLTKKKFTALTELGMEDIAKLLWIMLRKEEPGLTIEKTLDIIDENIDSMEYLTDKITEVVEAAFPKSKEGADPNVQAPGADT